ncbi:site-specific DNA-methyltransferase [Kibdelosporangium philippinense]|uniref:Methyltransferase n=1 Tax=Kibdelosporangium philippinense TaxID=211113 RepID=A0ABS8ZPR3_9PSEU|nr:site-specific DNA-methyltransferase [Kibdelosporangium philippinense]MCE7009564.1 site-specific DNA-methyltransferase [Kibdelosporangium philippinense]
MSHAPNLPLNKILIGDARARLTELPDAAVDTIITSPPYWALRDYGHDGQLGAEASVDAWADEIAALATQFARVLTPTGSLWLNLGDSYARTPKDGALKKSLLLAPQRVALRLVSAGWLLRNQVVWSKTNPMPSSVTDRLTTTHEFVYLFTRAQRYHFDLDTIREPTGPSAPALKRLTHTTYPPRAAVPALGGGNSPRIDLNQGLASMKVDGRDSHPLGKNPGDVWRLATANYRGAHFATFPAELVRRPLLSTCPERVCVECGRPWRRAFQVIDGRKLSTGPLRSACGHRRWRPGRVLDPFMGAGTVAIAAEEHGRDWIGIELNPEYAALAERRLADWRTKHANSKHQGKGANP